MSIKDNDQKHFLLCYVKHIDPVKIHPEKLMQKDKELFSDPDYERIKCFMSEQKNKVDWKNNNSILFIMKID